MDWEDRLDDWEVELELSAQLEGSDWVTLDRAAAGTGVSRAALRNWYRTGQIPSRLAADAVYQQAAGTFLSATKQDPAYQRFSSSLLVAFNGMKHMVVPPPDHRPNVFELRTYISSSENKGLSKIKMFESGEITLMKQIGLAPIFYSRTLVGPQMPSLVYMTCGETMDAHKDHWKAFSNAPVWKQLQADPQYKDNVATVVRIMLKRTPASQI